MNILNNSKRKVYEYNIIIFLVFFTYLIISVELINKSDFYFFPNFILFSTFPIIIFLNIFKNYNKLILEKTIEATEYYDIPYNETFYYKCLRKINIKLSILGEIYISFILPIYIFTKFDFNTYINKINTSIIVLFCFFVFHCCHYITNICVILYCWNNFKEYYIPIYNIFYRLNVNNKNSFIKYYIYSFFTNFLKIVFYIGEFMCIIINIKDVNIIEICCIILIFLELINFYIRNKLKNNINNFLNFDYHSTFTPTSPINI